ncbi:MAG: adenine phosphoribosyltransferase [Planctomycetota bacterium]|nr:adenine phosphoribosyltransferase [Planctomycetota bacterium]MDA1106573.1 adenine phosphoribosyltransferase [Planctomycetota bacterium]
MTVSLKSFIRDVADYPSPGILYRDITPLLADRRALAQAINEMASPFRDGSIDFVVGPESRGFIFATALARELNAGFVPVRKKGKLPRATHAVQYELEYGADELHVHEDAIRPGARVLIADDVLATGGTMRAVLDLCGRSGGAVMGVSVLIELAQLGGRATLAPTRVESVLTY